MEAQLQRPQHDQYQDYEHEPAHDTIGLHSPGYEDEVHVAPTYDESLVIPGTNLPIQTDINLEPTDTRQDIYNPNEGNDNEGIFMRQSGPGKMEFDFERSSVEARRPEFEIPLPQSKPDATFMEEANVAEPMVQISPLMGNLEEDPHSPKSLPAKIPPSNYQSKVTDPTGHGGEEANVDPILERLDNFHIHDKSDQSTPTVDQFSPESKVNPSKIPESSDQAEPESMPRDTITGKISSATSAIAGKAVSAKDAVASRLGYGDVSSNKNKVAEKLAPVYGAVTGAGSAVMSSVERGNDRAVSVSEYLAAKLRPGDDDKALSEAITGRFYKKEEGMAPGRVVEVVAERSGGGGVVDRLKEAVGFGKSSGIGLSDGSVPVIKEEIESEAMVHELGN
ncbi:hypothetical protein CASFOL_023596 [Castilleja foliolosa]|uniref:Uncharacterized protein n=1 Tax=Castilleja foliolosa TaxID=1961234 RepID=A0ABD3CM05_9LAMI